MKGERDIPNGFVAAEHLHPYQSERFEILKGEVEVKLANLAVMCGTYRPIRDGLTTPLLTA